MPGPMPVGCGCLVPEQHQLHVAMAVPAGDLGDYRAGESQHRRPGSGDTRHACFPERHREGHVRQRRVRPRLDAVLLGSIADEYGRRELADAYPYGEEVLVVGAPLPQSPPGAGDGREQFRGVGRRLSTGMFLTHRSGLGAPQRGGPLLGVLAFEFAVAAAPARPIAQIVRYQHQRRQEQEQQVHRVAVDGEQHCAQHQRECRHQQRESRPLAQHRATRQRDFQPGRGRQQPRRPVDVHVPLAVMDDGSERHIGDRKLQRRRADVQPPTDGQWHGLGADRRQRSPCRCGAGGPDTRPVGRTEVAHRDAVGPDAQDGVQPRQVAVLDGDRRAHRPADGRLARAQRMDGPAVGPGDHTQLEHPARRRLLGRHPQCQHRSLQQGRLTDRRLTCDRLAVCPGRATAHQLRQAGSHRRERCSRRPVDCDVHRDAGTTDGGEAQLHRDRRPLVGEPPMLPGQALSSGAFSTAPARAGRCRRA